MDFDEFVKEQEEKEQSNKTMIGCSPTTAASAGLVRTDRDNERWQDYMNGGYPGLEDVYWE